MENLKCAIIEDSAEFAQFVDWLMGESRVDKFKEVSHFTDNGYDVVFCDLRLKETWGVDTVKALRAKTTSAIIVLTGLGTGETQPVPSGGATFLTGTDHVLYLNAGADEVFLKDKTQDPLFPDLVKEVIQKRKSRNAQSN